MWSRIIILRIDTCKYLFLSKQYFAWQPWKCFKSAWIWLWKKVEELCGQDAANHARFWWSTIRHPYKLPQPAQMVFHSGGHCDGNLLRCFLNVGAELHMYAQRFPMWKTSFGNECSTRIWNKSAVEYALTSEGVPGRLICAEKGTEGLNKAARSPVHLSLFKASCQHSTVSGPHSVLMGLHITAPLKSFNPYRPRDTAGVLVRVRLFTYLASSSELCGWWWSGCCKQMGCRQPPQY